jgi:hypothetical protein
MVSGARAIPEGGGEGFAAWPHRGRLRRPVRGASDGARGDLDADLDADISVMRTPGSLIQCLVRKLAQMERLSAEFVNLSEDSRSRRAPMLDNVLRMRIGESSAGNSRARAGDRSEWSRRIRAVIDRGHSRGRRPTLGDRFRCLLSIHQPGPDLRLRDGLLLLASCRD